MSTEVGADYAELSTDSGAQIVRTPSGRHVAIDQASAHAITGRGIESWPGVARSALVTAGTVLVVHIDPTVSKWALIVLAAIASPALVRAVIAPALANRLRRF